MTQFKDHFSGHAAAYAAARPTSPPELFSYLATLTPHRRVALDVGTGNGQAAVELVKYFDSVIAIDASANQIKEAVPHPKITYGVAPAEKFGVAPASIDLITVAQAAHWFDFEKFNDQVRKACVKGGVLAIWTYDVAEIAPDVDAVVSAYYDGDIASYWPPERRHVESHYQTIPFPFEEIKSPRFQIVQDRNLKEWCGYLYSWSATQRAIQNKGPEIFEGVVKKLERVWGNPEIRRRVAWPVYLRAGRVGP